MHHDLRASNGRARAKASAPSGFAIAVLVTGYCAGSHAAVEIDQARDLAVRAVAGTELSFVRNDGQYPSDARYVAATQEHWILVADDGVHLAARAAGSIVEVLERSSLRMTICDPAASFQRVDEGRRVSTYNYFGRGGAEGRAIAAPVFDRLRVRDVIPGVDVLLYSNQGKLEYDLVIAPDSGLSAVEMCFDGAESVVLTDDGSLVIDFGGAEIRQPAPTAFELDESGRQTPITAQFQLSSAPNGVNVRFAAEKASSTVVVDPVIEVGTLIGGGSDDFLGDIAFDDAGNVYLTGITYSADFPVFKAFDGTANGSQSTLGELDSADVFVIKINPRAQVVEWATFFGGGGYDAASAIAVSGAGEVTIAGNTRSPDLPVKNAIQYSCPACDAESGSASAGFVAKFSASGGSLVYSSFLGGGATPGAANFYSGSALRDIELLPDGSVWVLGWTSWSDVPVTTTVGGRQCLAGAVPPSQDVFLARIGPLGTLEYSACLPSVRDGPGLAHGLALSRDPIGNLYLAGRVIPYARGIALVNPLPGVTTDPSNHSLGFVSKLNPQATVLLQSTYVGGSAPGGWVQDIAVDSSGAVVAVGLTLSPDFPVVDAVQSNLKGDTDGFVLKLAPGGGSLNFSTYFGASDTGVGLGSPSPGRSEGLGRVALGPDGSIFVVGSVIGSDLAQLHPLQPLKSVPPIIEDRLRSSRIIAEFTPTGRLAMTSYVGDWTLSSTVVQSAGARFRARDGSYWWAMATGALEMPLRNVLGWERPGSLDVHMAKLDRRTQHRRLATLPDMNSNAASELAMLRDPGLDGLPIVEIRDGKAGTPLGQVKFLARNLYARDVLAVPDVNGDGKTDIGVLGARQSDGRTVFQIKSGAMGNASNATISDVWLDEGFLAADIALVPDVDGNGIGEVLFLARRQADDQAVLILKNLKGATNPRRIPLAGDFRPLGVVGIPDSNGDGKPDAAVLLERISDLRGLVEVVSLSAPHPRVQRWVSEGYVAHSIVALGDKDGDSIAEFAIAASRRTDGRIAVETMNVAGAARKTIVWFKPGHYVNGLVSVGDSDANGVPDVSVISTRASDGRVVLETKNVNGSTMPRETWYAPGYAPVFGIGDAFSDGKRRVAVAVMRDRDLRPAVIAQNVQDGLARTATFFSVDPWYPGNLPPTADAGPDSFVGCGEVKYLTGRAYDRDGTISSVSWRQVAGPSAQVQQANSLQSRITAPTLEGAGSEIIAFELAVTDDKGAKHSDVVLLSVGPSAACPQFVEAVSVAPQSIATISLWERSPDRSSDLATTWLVEQVSGPTLEWSVTSRGLLRVLTPGDSGQLQRAVFLLRPSVGEPFRLPVEVYPRRGATVVEDGDSPDGGTPEVSALQIMQSGIGTNGIFPDDGTELVFPVAGIRLGENLDPESTSVILAGRRGSPADVTEYFETDVEEGVIRLKDSERAAFRALLATPNGQFSSRWELVISVGTTAGKVGQSTVEFVLGAAELSFSFRTVDGTAFRPAVPVRFSITGQSTGSYVLGSIRTDGTASVKAVPYDSFGFVVLDLSGRYVGNANVTVVSPASVVSVEVTVVDLAVQPNTQAAVTASGSPIVTGVVASGLLPETSRSMERRSRLSEARARPVTDQFASGTSCQLPDGGAMSVSSGLQNTTISCVGQLMLPDSTERVSVRVVVETAEFPSYTQSQSDYDDKWSYVVDLAGRAVFADASSVNRTHTNAGSIVPVDRCIELPAAADGPRIARAVIGATNVGDSSYPTVVRVSITSGCGGAGLKVTSFNASDTAESPTGEHRGLKLGKKVRVLTGNGRGISGPVFSVPHGPAGHSKIPLDATIEFEPRDAVLSGASLRLHVAQQAIVLVENLLDLPGVSVQPGKIVLKAVQLPQRELPSVNSDVSVSVSLQGTVDGQPSATDPAAPFFMRVRGDMQFAPLYDMSLMTVSATRYSVRDDAVGGDGWARAETLTWLNGFGLTRIRVNDVAALHGAHVETSGRSILDHKGHCDGAMIDLRYLNEEGVATDGGMSGLGNQNEVLAVAAAAKLEVKAQAPGPNLGRLTAWITYNRSLIDEMLESGRVRKIIIGDGDFYRILKLGKFPAGGGTIPGWDKWEAAVSKAPNHVDHFHVELNRDQ